MNETKTRWEPGDRAVLAHRVGTTKQKLCDVLKGRRRADATLAEMLTVEARLLGYETSIFDWMFSSRTDNPLFG